MKKKENFEIIATNRRARFDYEIFDEYIAGIVLYGSEIKSIRLRQVNINSAFIRIENDEAFIYGMQISPYKFETVRKIDEFRKRKLLLHSSEIKKLKNQSERKGYTIIPLELFIKNGWAKLKIAVGRGRKKFDKKEYLKERDIEKEIKKDLGY